MRDNTPFVVLEPRDKRGKQLLKENGPVWDLLYESDHCIAFDAPGLFIRSRVNPKEQRWIRRGGLPHFYIKQKKGSA